MFIHTVYFKLKSDAPAGARDALIRDCRERLTKVPTVGNVHVGLPADTDRPVIDKSYTVALCIVFADKAAHDVYQDHPIHIAFVDANKGHWEKVTVTDFIDVFPATAPPVPAMP